MMLRGRSAAAAKVATVMTSTSRATGSSAVFSKIAVSFRKPSMSCGEAAIRAMAAGR